MALSNKAFLKNLLPSDNWNTFIDEVDSVASGTVPAGSISATELATDSVETIKIKDANVTAAKLAATLDLSSKTITTGAISTQGKISLLLSGGAASASGLLMGVGTTADPSTTAVADAKFAEFRTESTATSGDSRGLYWRHSLNGAGVSGETIRAFSKIEAAAATCRGAHISLDVATAGSCSGLGIGVDNQILVHDGALTGGTYAVTNAEIYSAGSSTDVSGVTEISLFRAVLGGDATGAANVDDNANLITLTGGSIASGNIVQAETDETKFSHKIRCNFNGTTLYLMATAT